VVWGTYLEKNCPSSNGHILVFGGSKRLPRWFGALINRRTIQVKMGMCLFFCVFREKKHKNTKTHRLSDAILLLKKDKETFGHCVFVFFGKKKKHKSTKTH